jgi:methylamine dehydrogenase heavy chain
VASLGAASLLAASAQGQPPDAPAAGTAEPLGRVASLPSIGEHAVWVADVILGHSLLFDGDTGEMLGTIDAGVTLSPKPPLYGEERGEFYSVDIDYSRGRRGDRIDYVTIYDASRLDAVGEVMLPTRTSESAASLAYAALLDGGRFLATFNQFPATSVSIVDLAERRFVEEIVTSGCAGIYPTGARSFAMLCGDGSMLVVELDARGAKRSLHETGHFFDVLEDPVMMAGGRLDRRWLFVSYAGRVYEIDFAQVDAPVIRSWWLSTESERSQGWRPGGRQHVAVHEASGRLYVVFHQGGPGTHKDPGPEVWVFDASTRTRVDRFEMPNFTATFLGDTLGLEEGGVLRLLLGTLLPDEGADTIAVTKDPAPLLFARNSRLGSVAVLDARSGEHLRDLTEVGLAGMRLEVPR